VIAVRAVQARFEPRAAPTGGLSDLHFLGGNRKAVAVSPGGGRHSFAIVLQTSGEGVISRGETSMPLANSEAFVIAPLSNVVWRPAGSEARCIVALGGPAFSLRLQPPPLDGLRLTALNPVTALLTDLLVQLEAIVPTADPLISRRLAETLTDVIDVAIDNANDSVSTRRLLDKLIRAEPRLDDPGFDAPALAEACDVTLRSLQKRLKPLNTSPRRWILERRLERARRKLDSPSFSNLTIREIALHSGFGDLAYFFRSFRTAFGISPSQYRRGSATAGDAAE
jgi:AraC-like DNA-binding protein